MRSQLTEIVIHYQPKFDPLPDPVKMTDWNPNELPTETQFWSFLQSINYLPVHTIEGVSDKSFIMSSGVKATFSDAKLHKLQLTRHTIDENDIISLTDEREPSIKEIQDMFDEAENATEAGSPRAGLVLVWAGLEAVLRRAALRAGLQGRIGIQPGVLIRGLLATRKISQEDSLFLEQVRQLRTATAHGLAPQPIDPELLRDIIKLANRVLAECETRQPVAT